MRHVLHSVTHSKLYEIFCYSLCVCNFSLVMFLDVNLFENPSVGLCQSLSFSKKIYFCQETAKHSGAVPSEHI